MKKKTCNNIVPQHEETLAAVTPATSSVLVENQVPCVITLDLGAQIARELEPDFEPDGSFTTCFAMGKNNGRHMTKLEAKYEHLIKNYGQMIHMLDRSSMHPDDMSYILHHAGRPWFVPPTIWENACLGDAASIRTANRLQPGCVYGNTRIMKLIRHHTAIAAQGTDLREARKSRSWLQTSLIPVGIKSSRKDNAATVSRGVLGQPVMDMFRDVFGDIVRIRNYSKSVGVKIANTHRTEKTLIAFPELSALTGKTAFNANRKPWASIVLKYLSADADQNLSDKDAAIRILADITGYQPTKVEHSLLEMSAHSLLPIMKEIRKSLQPTS